MTLSKRDDTANGNSEHYIVLCGELALEEAMDDLLEDRLRNEYS
jgi:hypothetical protein